LDEFELRHADYSRRARARTRWKDRRRCREGQAGMEDAVGLAVRVRGSRPDDAGLVGQDHGLDPVAEPELGQQVPDV
jgi:hypothetical protein